MSADDDLTTPDGLALALARMQVQLEVIGRELGEIKTARENEAKTNNERLTDLERWRSRITGAIAVIAVLGPIISGVVTALVVSYLT